MLAARISTAAKLGCGTLRKICVKGNQHLSSCASHYNVFDGLLQET